MKMFLHLVLLAASLTTITGCVSRPHLVFETDFASANLVKFGGAASLNSMSAITDTKPFGNAGGPALIVSNCCFTCADCNTLGQKTGGIIIKFADLTNSLASIFHEQVTAGATNHTLVGAVDFFVLAGISTNVPSEQPTNDDCRSIDYWMFDDWFRSVIRGRSGTNALCDVQFICPQTNALVVAGTHTNNATTMQPANKSFLEPGKACHLAVTFKTSRDREITMTLWIQEGTGAISTCRTKAAYSSVQFRIDESLVPSSAFANTQHGIQDMNFGCLEKAPSPTPILFDRIRIWDGVPRSIPGL